LRRSATDVAGGDDHRSDLDRMRMAAHSGGGAPGGAAAIESTCPRLDNGNARAVVCR
jgi:hypothetical protein